MHELGCASIPDAIHDSAVELISFEQLLMSLLHATTDWSLVWLTFGTSSMRLGVLDRILDRTLHIPPTHCHLSRSCKFLPPALLRPLCKSHRRRTSLRDLPPLHHILTPIHSRESCISQASQTPNQPDHLLPVQDIHVRAEEIQVASDVFLPSCLAKVCRLRIQIQGEDHRAFIYDLTI